MFVLFYYWLASVVKVLRPNVHKGNSGFPWRRLSSRILFINFFFLDYWSNSLADKSSELYHGNWAPANKHLGRIFYSNVWIGSNSIYLCFLQTARPSHLASTIIRLCKTYRKGLKTLTTQRENLAFGGNIWQINRSKSCGICIYAGGYRNYWIIVKYQ